MFQLISSISVLKQIIIIFIKRGILVVLVEFVIMKYDPSVHIFIVPTDCSCNSCALTGCISSIKFCYISHLPQAKCVSLLGSETVSVIVFRYAVSHPPLVSRFVCFDFLYSTSFAVCWKIKPRPSMMSL